MKAVNFRGQQLVQTGAGGGGLTNINVSAGTTSNNLSNVVFSNLNGVSFGLAGSTITASHNGLTSQSNQAFSADVSSTFQTLTFQDSNGVSFSNNAGALRVTHALQFTSNTSDITSNALHSSASRVINLIAATNNTGGGTASLSSNVSFSNANGATFYTSAGNAIVLSYTVPAAGAVLAISAAGNSVSAGTVVWSNSNNVSFGMNASTITATATFAQSNQQMTMFATGNTTQSSTGTTNASSLIFRADGIVSVGITGGSIEISATQSNQAFSAGAASSTFQTLSFQDSNGLSFSNNAGAIRVSYTRNVVSNAIQAVGSATGSGTNTSRFAADDHVHAGVFSLGVSTAGGTAGTTTVGPGQFVLQGSNLTLSQITAVGLLNTIVISAAAPGGAAATLSGFNPYADQVKVAGQVGQSVLQFDPMRVGNAFQFDRAMHVLNFTATSNSSGSGTLSLWLGIYTRNVSSLSLLTSQSTSTNWTMSGTVGSYSLWSGQRFMSMPLTTTLSVGDYWLGIVSRTTTAGAAGFTVSQQLVSNINSDFVGVFGASHNTTNQLTLGQGVYTAGTTGIPGSLGFSQIRGSDSLARRAPFVMFASGTV
jgi:hypothetical protein